ncbi:hypothetical protein ES703_45214 [subsurface metagenome]
MTVIPHLLRDYTATPKGYIRTAEAYRYPAGPSREENMILPRKHVYCGLYLQSWYHDEGLRHHAAYIELNLNNGEKMPYRQWFKNYCADVTRMYGSYQFTGVWTPATGADIPIQVEEGVVVGQVQSPIDHYPRNSFTDDNGYFVKVVKTGGVAPDTVELEIVYKVKGILPWSMLAIPHFDPRNPETWVDSDKLGDFWLRVIADSEAGSNATLKLLGETVIPQ